MTTLALNTIHTFDFSSKCLHSETHVISLLDRESQLTY